MNYSNSRLIDDYFTEKLGHEVKIMKIIRYEAWKNFRRGHILDIDDLISLGVMAAIKCLNSYSPDKGVKFETYAHARINGEMKDEFRRLSDFKRCRAYKSGIPNIENSKKEMIDFLISNNFSHIQEIEDIDFALDFFQFLNPSEFSALCQSSLLQIDRIQIAKNMELSLARVSQLITSATSKIGEKYGIFRPDL